MSNQEDDITEIFGKLKTIFLRIRLGTKNKPRGFELNTRKIGTKMKKEWMDFKDEDEKEKFNQAYPGKKLGDQEVYFFDHEKLWITKSNINDFLKGNIGDKSKFKYTKKGLIESAENPDEQWKGKQGLEEIKQLYLKNKDHPFFKIPETSKKTKKKKEKKEKDNKKIKVKRKKLNLTFDNHCSDKKELEEIVSYVNSDKLNYEDERYKKFLICKEKSERESLNNTKKYNTLYPLLEDPQFNKKISLKKEFENTTYNKKTQEDIENIIKIQDKMCKNKQFELAPHQVFIRNFMSLQTPYNGLLIYHGLGTGKTCSSINVAEEQRFYYKQMGIDKQIIVVANKKVQEGYKLQLFDETKLKRTNGVWNIKSCAGNNFINEIVFTKDSKYSELDEKEAKQILVKQIKKLIKKYYKFYGYVEFSNEINKVVKQFQLNKIETIEDMKKNKLKALRQRFNNTLIIIDEVHNIRPDSEIKGLKKTSQNFLDLVTYTENMKLLLLTGTPMFNHYSEIIWILNLLNRNDNRYTLSVSDIFDNDGNFTENGKDLLIKKSTGYISYLQGEDPFSFPFRLYPYDINLPDGNIIKENSLKNLMENNENYYPKLQVNGAIIDNTIQNLDLFMNNMEETQWKYYSRYIDYLNKTSDVFRSKGKSLQYTLITTPLQLTNFCFPHRDFDTEQETEAIFNKISGIKGLVNCFNATEKEVKKYKKLKYKSGIYKNLFSREKLKLYSKKIFNIMNIIEKSEGIIILYSNFIAGGCVPLACALEELGFDRYNEDNILHKDHVTKNDKKGNYIMLTGDTNLSKNDKKNYIDCTSSRNKNGELIKVIIISEAASEGLDFKNVRQVHILEPWFNLYRTGQIEGRGIRYKSHCELKFEKRNCLIFLHGSYIDNQTEIIDLYVYRLAEKKALEIGNVTRVLKQNSVDCVLNESQQNLSQDFMNKNVMIDVSYQQSANRVKNSFKIGHRNNSLICDYQNCNYKCNVDDFNGDFSDSTTFDYSFIIMSIDKIIERIKSLFKERYVFTKSELLSYVKGSANYTNPQIYQAIEFLMTESNQFLEDIYGKKGKIVEIGNLYFFHPIDLEMPIEPLYTKKVPFYYKPDNIQYSYTSNLIDLTKDEDIIENIEQLYLTVYNPIEEECKNINDCINLAIKTFIKEKYYSVFREIAFHSIIEKLSIRKKRILFDNKDNLTENLSLIVNKFFEKYKIDTNYLLPDFKKKTLETKSDKKNKMSDGSITEIARELYNFDLIKLEKQETIGILSHNKSGELIFKIKYIQDLSNISKGEKLNKIAGGKSRLMNLYIDIKESNEYEDDDDLFIGEEIKDEEIERIENIQNIDNQLEIIIELLYRFYQLREEEGENKKIWFVNSINSLLYNISRFPNYLKKDKLKAKKGKELKSIKGDNYTFQDVNKIQKENDNKNLDDLILELKNN